MLQVLRTRRSFAGMALSIIYLCVLLTFSAGVPHATNTSADTVHSANAVRPSSISTVITYKYLFTQSFSSPGLNGQAFGNLTYTITDGDEDGKISVKYVMDTDCYYIGCVSGGAHHECTWTSTASASDLLIETCTSTCSGTYLGYQSYWDYNLTDVTSKPATIQRRHEWAAVIDFKTGYGKETFTYLREDTISVMGKTYEVYVYENTLSYTGSG